MQSHNKQLEVSKSIDHQLQNQTNSRVNALTKGSTSTTTHNAKPGVNPHYAKSKEATISEILKQGYNNIQHSKKSSSYQPSHLKYRLVLHVADSSSTVIKVLLFDGIARQLLNASAADLAEENVEKPEGTLPNALKKLIDQKMLFKIVVGLDNLKSSYAPYKVEKFCDQSKMVDKFETVTGFIDIDGDGEVVPVKSRKRTLSERGAPTDPTDVSEFAHLADKTPKAVSGFCCRFTRHEFMNSVLIFLNLVVGSLSIRHVVQEYLITAAVTTGTLVRKGMTETKEKVSVGKTKVEEVFSRPIASFEKNAAKKTAQKSKTLLTDIERWQKKLSNVNYNTLEFITALLLRVSQKYLLNKMDSHNLDMEMAMMIMWREDKRPESYREYWRRPSMSPKKSNDCF
ncbi:unnamed protein product [Arabis nemorensis]|uniref:Rho-GAP domain-containing protein n=1 Tax=Arabis nemorensis TaxID=586526 RepID=A0A565CCU0_9BRAS|nr:unnamed protein product [Arabis nemorensis]